MIRYFVLIGIYALAGVAGGDGLDDFSNNLATDLAPLLVLFGEAMTKQYLSESTSSLDYLIFATAPVGILTAMVSAIRVCGHSSMRAFIGRAQEGNGAVEAELCTSTSRDVCELFNTGSIARVLGRPRILELVHAPRRWMGSKKRTSPHEDHVDLYLSKTYFKESLNYFAKSPQYTEKSVEDTSAPEWRPVEGSVSEKPIATERMQTLFAPHPNLSLNVGIVKQPKAIYITIAIVGVILQGGIIVFAVAATWSRLDLVADDGTGKVPGIYAPIMFISGTTLMCFGMWACACLIGQTTREIRFKRNVSPDQGHTRLLWLQPGPQTVGDQVFDPFAYLENPKSDPIQTWISSRKELHSSFEPLTFLAVMAVLIGYLAQFIGLRGMNAWISIAQLGITLVMSTLRGTLRMRRIGKSVNGLRHVPNLVPGHELDWLSYKIFDRTRDQGLTEPYSEDHDAHPSVIVTGPDDDEIPTKTIQSKTDAAQVENEYLLRVRTRLARLTGCGISPDINPADYQKWKDEDVKVRVKARQLSAAICNAMPKLFRDPDEDIELSVTIPSFIKKPWAKPSASISVSIKAPSSSQTGWTMDTARIEAILGVWTWSALWHQRREFAEGSDPLKKNVEDSAHIESFTENTRWSRMVPSRLDRGQSDSKGELQLWLGSDDVDLVRFAFTDIHYGFGRIGTIWHSHPLEYKEGGEVVMDSVAAGSKMLMTPRKFRRLLGWGPFQQEIDKQGQATSHITGLSAYYTDLASEDATLYDACAQELFAAITKALATKVHFGRLMPVESCGTVRLHNNKVIALFDAFTHSGIGSRSDAVMCIVPAVRDYCTFPAPEKLLLAVSSATNGYHLKPEWKQPESILKWICQRLHETPDTPEHLFSKALLALGELYRWTLVRAQGSRDQNVTVHAWGGINWMVKSFYEHYSYSTEIQSILDRYHKLFEKILEERTGRFKDRYRSQGNIFTTLKMAASPAANLVQAAQEAQRDDALFWLCSIEPDTEGLQELDPVLPLAAKHEWFEIVDAVLELKVNLNARDEEGRTALSHLAQKGHVSCVDLLLQRGAFPDVPDHQQRTPLSFAAQSGRHTIIHSLIKAGVDINRVDGARRTPLIWGAEHGHGDVVKSLVLSRARIDHQDDNGRTALMIATANKHNYAVQVLRESGAIETFENTADD